MWWSGCHSKTTCRRSLPLREPMKIVCPGGYTWLNKGDAALVLAMLAELRRVAPAAEIVLLSDTPALDGRRYGATVLPPLYGGTLELDDVRPGLRRRVGAALRHHIVRRVDDWLTGGGSRTSSAPLALWGERLRFHAFLIWLFIVIGLAGRGSHRWVGGQAGRTLREFCEADFAVFVPGGYLIAPHPGHVYWFRHLAAMFAARWLKLPICFTPCSIGPFRGAYNGALAKWALNHPHRILAREQSSLETLARIAPRAQRELVPDLGFLLSTCASTTADRLRATLATGGRRALGISVRDYRFPDHSEPVAQRARYISAVAHAVDHAIERHGLNVCFVPQVLADAVSDLSVSREVAARVRNAEHVRVMDLDLDPRELKDLYGNFDLFMGVRMHANIFALGAGVPTVAIAYEPKTQGIMEQLGLGEFVIGIYDLDAPRLVALLDRLVERAPALRDQLAATIPLIRRDAMRTADVLREAMPSA